MKLLDWRKQQNLTLAQVARRLDTTEVSVSRYETGQRIPGPGMMDRIARLTGNLVLPNDFYALAGGDRAAGPDAAAGDPAPDAVAGIGTGEATA